VATARVNPQGRWKIYSKSHTPRQGFHGLLCDILSKSYRSFRVPRDIPQTYNTTQHRHPLVAASRSVGWCDGVIGSGAPLLACGPGSIAACSAEPDAEECGEGDKRQKAI
jgi:hypothetical protein